MGLVGANGQPVMSAAALAGAIAKSVVGGREILYWREDRLGQERYQEEAATIVRNTPTGPQLNLQALVSRALTNGMNIEALVRQQVEDAAKIADLQERLAKLEAVLCVQKAES